jgi:hypothetical protein
MVCRRQKTIEDVQGGTHKATEGGKWKEESTVMHGENGEAMKVEQSQGKSVGPILK